jgi:2-polyprenyl-3-methyl-5-hydroxy-6-metoxy-1,4-benzoquinol methylase
LSKQKFEKTQEAYANGLLSGFLQRERLRQAAKYVKLSDNVLDLACDEGALLEYLPTNIHYIGIDISERAIAQAQVKYPQHTFRVADLTKPNVEMLGNDQFNVIVMLAFLEHVKNPGELLKSYAPHLKTNGVIVVTTPAPFGRFFHDVGAKIGLFSKNAAQEHEIFLNYQMLADIARAANLHLQHYRRFLFGLNQLACFSCEIG